MEQLLLHLRNLGFTEMESKIMVELATKGEASGYEVAKQLGVSRSNVYAALQRLTQQGYVRCGEGEPARYSVLDPEELATMISAGYRLHWPIWRVKCRAAVRLALRSIISRVTAICWGR
ncbi:TrmB family transcriptional regulator [Paenibacillus ihuae]|uniref:TrmB family transcriptional regulator n=1 Tax=Paenibacillus ihuae TaxID=1232431 RepID=UPI000A869043